MMEISLKKIADCMVERYGIEPGKIRAEDFEGWTDTFMDAMEYTYGLESKVARIIRKMEGS